jgi:putative transcriptional regulator
MRTPFSELIRKPGWFTEFQVLTELAQRQSRMRQRDLADALGITVQAVSKHVRRLVAVGVIAFNGVEYVLTPRGIEKLTEYTKTLETHVKKASSCLRLERLWPAIACKPITAGEEIGLVMKDGVICADSKNHKDAKAFGIAIADASKGEDVALRDLRGAINLRRGKVVVAGLPNINQGGSRNVDIAKVGEIYRKSDPDRIGVIGTVARAVTNKLRFRIDFEFGVTRSTAMAALRGLNVLVLSTGRMTNRVFEEIEKVNVRYSCEIPCTIEDCQLSRDFEFKQNSLAASLTEAE